MVNPVLTDAIEAAIQSAGMINFRASDLHFKYSDPRATAIAIGSIIPPQERTKFDPVRAGALLNGFQSDSILPPIEVDQPPGFAAGTFRLRDGFHRYHLSKATGFLAIPAIVLPYFDA